MDDIGHATQLLGHVVQDVNVSVLASDVLKELLGRAVGLDVLVGPLAFVEGNGQAVDVAALRASRLVLDGSVGEQFQVFACDVVLREVFGQEVHHGLGIVGVAVVAAVAVDDLDGGTVAHGSPVVRHVAFDVDSVGIDFREIFLCKNAYGVRHVNA